MLKLQTVYKIKIIYKSGAEHTFETLEFNYSVKSGKTSVSWDCDNLQGGPILIGVDDIVAVFQISTRKRIAWR